MLRLRRTWPGTERGPGPPSGQCTSSLLACLIGPAALPRCRRRPDSEDRDRRPCPAVVLTGSFEPEPAREAGTYFSAHWQVFSAFQLESQFSWRL